MIQRNQHYSLGGTTIERKKLVYDYDTEKKVIYNLRIYEGPINLEDGMFIPDKLQITNVEDDSEIRDSLAGLKLKLSKDLGINEADISVSFSEAI